MPLPLQVRFRSLRAQVQETFIIALRHRWNQEHVDDLHDQIAKLQEKVPRAGTAKRYPKRSDTPSTLRFRYPDS